MSEVVFVDTSVLLNILNVPGKNSDHRKIYTEFKILISADATLVIPIAAVVEVGNHIANLSAGDQRRDRSRAFEAFLRAALDGDAPWVVSGASWDKTFLGRLVDGHESLPGLTDLCVRQIGSGDASILLELHRYRGRSDLPSALPVRLWTLDKALAAYG